MTPTDTLREAVARAIKPLRWLGDTAVSSVGFYRIETFKSGFVWSVDGIRGNHLRPSKSSDDARLLAQADFAAKMLDAFDLDAALSAIEAAGWRVERGWQPINTAPRDGHWHHADLDIDLWHVQYGRYPDCYWSGNFNAWFHRAGGRAFNMGGDDRFSHWCRRAAAPRLDATVRSGEEG